MTGSRREDPVIILSLLFQATDRFIDRNFDASFLFCPNPLQLWHFGVSDTVISTRTLGILRVRKAVAFIDELLYQKIIRLNGQTSEALLIAALRRIVYYIWLQSLAFIAKMLCCP